MPSNASFAGAAGSSGGGSVRSNGYNSRRIWAVAGSFTFTVPAGVTELLITAFGAGGSGPRGDGGNVYYSGGAAGGLAEKTVTVSPGDTVTITVGAGGAARTAVGQAGANGGTTSVVVNGVTLTATGGQGGTYNAAGSRAAGGVGSGGDINRTGGPGGLTIGRCYSGPGGGGAPTRMRDGFRGGDVIPENSTAYYNGAGGAGLGGAGGDIIFTVTSGASGGGALAAGRPNASDGATTAAGAAGHFPGGDGGVNLPGSYVVRVPQSGPGGLPWWDIDEIGGSSGAAGNGSSATATPGSSGPGAGGSGGASTGAAIGDGGIFGGGAGFGVDSRGRAGNGGNGAGGGASVGTGTANNGAQSGAGGDGWVGIYFNRKAA